MHRVPVAGRNRQEIENLIGFFVDTLVLRTNLSGKPDFLKHLKNVREVCLSAYAHQDIPFEKLVAELQSQRDMSRNPFFDIWVNQFNKKTKPFNIPGLEATTIELSNVSAKFAITFS